MPRFGKPELRDFRAKVQAKLAALSAELGLDLVLGEKAYYGDTMTVSLIASEKRADGKPPETEYEKAFRAHAQLFGFKPEDLGRLFLNRGDKFKLVGLNPNAHKMPMIGERLSNGKKFKFTSAEVLAGLMTEPGKTAAATSTGVATGKKRTDAEIIKDIQQVDGALSPENLSCDGEASASWVRTEGARLRRTRAALVSELGREPTDKELWG